MDFEVECAGGMPTGTAKCTKDYLNFTCSIELQVRHGGDSTLTCLGQSASGLTDAGEGHRLSCADGCWSWRGTGNTSWDGVARGPSSQPLGLAFALDPIPQEDVLTKPGGLQVVPLGLCADGV